MIRCFLITVAILRVCIFSHFCVGKGSSLAEQRHGFLLHLPGFQCLLKTLLVSTQIYSMPLAGTNLVQFVKKIKVDKRKNYARNVRIFPCLHAVCCLHLYVKDS